MKLLSVILIVISLLSQTASASIYIAYPSGMKNYENIAIKLKEKLKKNGINEIFILNKEDLKKEDVTTSDLTVFLGKTEKKNENKIKNPAIFSFSTKYKEQTENEWSIIKANQPAEKLLDTAKKTVTKEYRKNILLIISEDNKEAKEELKKIKKTEHVKIITIKKDEVAAKKIEPELEGAAAIVAIYDRSIWSGNSARWILQRAYNYHVPVIGYSKTFLKAGAMASVYSSADQILQETENHILQWSKTGKLNNKINYPEYTIEINNHIAKALNFNKIEIIDIGKKQ